MWNPRESDLIAVILPPGPTWLDHLASAWDAGAAVLPVDPRLPKHEIAGLIDQARPTHIFDGEMRDNPNGHVVGHRVALVIPTSGTAGKPKAVELTHEGLHAAINLAAARLGTKPDDKWLSCLPLSHIGGMLVVARALLTGAPIEIHERFDPNAIADTDAIYTSLVPTMLLRLLNIGAPVDRFHAILVGGGALPAALAQRAERAGARIVSTYGLTETCGGVVYDGLPLDEIEIRIRDDHAIQVRGPTLMHRYRDGSTAIEADGWLNTQDAGAISDGALRVHGRVDDLIITGGEKVWPAEVEAVLIQHPAIADAGVTRRSDPEWGQRVVAVIVPADPQRAPTLEEVRAFTRGRLARHKVPREIILVDALPRTASGKLRRSALLLDE